VHSFPYLCERLAWVGERVVVPSDEPGWTPFSIPLIIRGIVGEALTYVTSFNAWCGFLTLLLDFNKSAQLWTMILLHCDEYDYRMFGLSIYNILDVPHMGGHMRKAISQ
jgi:hypothetical protein